MELRGKACIVGYGETPHRRVWPGRTMLGLCAEVAAQAITDAGLQREDIDGLITYGGDAQTFAMAEYLGLRPTNFALGCQFAGASSGMAVTLAAHVIASGMAGSGFGGSHHCQR